jgi:hypothetical protein
LSWGTECAILSLVRKETLDALKDPAFREALGRSGIESSERQDMRAFLNEESVKFGRVVRDLGITMGQQ